MTYISKSFGVVSKELFAAAAAGSFGQAENVIRAKIPDFKMQAGEHNIYDVEVNVTGTMTIRVAAPSQASAMELANDIDTYSIIDDIDFVPSFTFQGVSSDQATDPDLKPADESE